MSNFLGQHWLLEYNDCNEALLADPVRIQSIMCAAAEQMGATIVTSTFHHFSPLGVSGVVVIQESHLTIHTWPEHQYAAVDIFTCGDIDMEKGAQYLENQLVAKTVSIQKMNRGKLKD